MKIQWLGHSCFKLTESTGTMIVADPYHSVGYEMPIVSADVVTTSHKHYDHSNIGAISGPPIVLNTEGFYDIKGVRITAISSYHDQVKGAKHGENLIFKYRMDGLDICHLGDIGHECTPQLLESLLPVNVLLIPIGGVSTIDAKIAKEYVDLIMPEIVIPMHYKTKSLNMDLDRAEEFLHMFEDNEIIISDSDTIDLGRDNIDEQSTKIIMLRRAK